MSKKIAIAFMVFIACIVLIDAYKPHKESKAARIDRQIAEIAAKWKQNNREQHFCPLVGIYAP